MSINHYPPEWLEDLNQSLTHLRSTFPQAHVYALIEGVLNESCYPLLKQYKRLPYFALYANSPAVDEETLCVSPILVEYLDDAKEIWNTLMKKTNGISALSIIATPEPMADLARRLTPWCVIDAAGYTLTLSFADTRILPELFRVLNPSQLAQLCGPMLHWQYVTRTAEWASLPLLGTTAFPASEVALDDNQCAQLMTAAEADNVLFQLRTTASGLVDCHSPARAHDLVRHWLACADHAQIGAAPDRRDLCEWALSYPGLESETDIAAWLLTASRPQSLEAWQRQWKTEGTA